MRRCLPFTNASSWNSSHIRTILLAFRTKTEKSTSMGETNCLSGILGHTHCPSIPWSRSRLASKGCLILCVHLLYIQLSIMIFCMIIEKVSAMYLRNRLNLG